MAKVSSKTTTRRSLRKDVMDLRCNLEDARHELQCATSVLEVLREHERYSPSVGVMAALAKLLADSFESICCCEKSLKQIEA